MREKVNELWLDVKEMKCIILFPFQQTVIKLVVEVHFLTLPNSLYKSLQKMETDMSVLNYKSLALNKWQNLNLT